jgi:hypothetical protein
MVSRFTKSWCRILDTLLVVSLFFVMAIHLAAAQPESDIKAYIEKLDNGKVEEVKGVLPDLITQYQDTPELIYLQGRLTTNGVEAAKYYQMVLDNYPQSEWADKSLYHLCQYHYAMGKYANAGKDMQRLRKEYPSSPILAEAAGLQFPREDRAPGKLADGEIGSSSNGEKAVTGVGRNSAREENRVNTSSSQYARSSKMYALQVGAFSTSVNADKQKSFFEKLGYPVEITSKIMMNKGLYLVWVGEYKNSEEAKRNGDRIRKQYKIKSMVVEK